MPWEEKTKSMMRERFVQEWQEGRKTKAALCREYGISRPTGDLWIQRWIQKESMFDRSHAPHTVPHRTPPDMEALIVSYRNRYPAAGAVTLHKLMKDEGISNLPCTKTFNNIFKRNCLITQEASQAAAHIQRFQHEAPNDLWQGDFKGHFAMTNGERCHPLNILDDCTRFNLCCEALAGETFEDIRPIMTRLFREYGLPKTFLCDNGNPWGTSQSVGFTRFEVWLMELGILTVHGRPLHPQTQGKTERFNRSLTRECLRYHQFEDLSDAQRKLDAYRTYYNEKRPHHALELKTPASQYTAAKRRFPERIEPWEYGAGYDVRQVKSTGYITYRNQGYFLSETFAGKEVAIRESHLSGELTLEFRQFRIARLNPNNGVFTLRKISRAEHQEE